MDFISILLIAIGLAMDAFAVSITIGLKTNGNKYKAAAKAGLWFGFFQASMNTIGWFLGSSFKSYVEAYSHWIGFVLLTLIGLNMIREAFGKEDKEFEFDGVKKVFILAVATSIDALAVGISFSTLGVHILMPAIVIGVTALIISIAGVLLGKVAAKIKGLSDKADILGGLILIGIGIKILLEHI